jgi:hypothetical protein
MVDYVQKIKEEPDFSEKMYGNWIKILGLNQVRKEKQNKQDSTREKERKQQQKMKKK